MSVSPKRSVINVMSKKSSAIAKQVELFVIAVKMKKAGLSDLFIVNAVRAALDIEGISDLMHLWMNETDRSEKEEIVADIQDLIDASLPKSKSKILLIKFNDLDAIANDIRGFKDTLFQHVINFGGVTKLAEVTGIPQPSLSRFFNSNSMPRRSTVLVIAKALNLDGVIMDERWSK